MKIFNRITKPVIFCFLLIPGIIFLPEGLSAQVITANDGFEGPHHKDYPPPAWSNCNDGVSTVDTQPGISHNFYEASEGESYISMVTRELNPPGTVETVWAGLIHQFEKDRCYNIQIDLSLSHDLYGTLNWGTEIYYFDNPCIFEVYAFNGNCYPLSDSELLWRSPVLENYSWQEFEFTLSPHKNTYQNIAFRVDFTAPYNYKNGVVFVDNMRLKNTSEITLSQNGKLTIPPGSGQITWYLNGQELPGEHSVQLIPLESGIYKAVFYDASGCLNIVTDTVSIENFPVLCYPNPTVTSVSLEFLSPVDNDCSVELYDLAGREIFSREYKLVKGKNVLTFDMSSLMSAYYMLVLKRRNMLANRFMVYRLNP